MDTQTAVRVDCTQMNGEATEQVVDASALDEVFAFTPMIVLTRDCQEYRAGAPQRSLVKSRLRNNNKVAVGGRSWVIEQFEQHLNPDPTTLYNSLWTLPCRRLLFHCRDHMPCGRARQRVQKIVPVGVRQELIGTTWTPGKGAGHRGEGASMQVGVGCTSGSIATDSRLLPRKVASSSTSFSVLNKVGERCAAVWCPHRELRDSSTSGFVHLIGKHRGAVGRSRSRDWFCVWEHSSLP